MAIQTDLQQFTDHAFRPRWRDAERCGFDLDPKQAGDRLCDVPKGEHRYSLQLPIEIEVWKPNPDAKYPGTVVIDYRRKIQDVLDELNARLPLEGVDFDEYGFTNMTKYQDPAYMEEGANKYRQYSLPWPDYRRNVVYPVTGGSEGHYVHIGSISMDGKLTTIGLCKTFRGWEYACRISMSAARLLQV